MIIIVNINNIDIINMKYPIDYEFVLYGAPVIF
jgi:hypothetical protein